MRAPAATSLNHARKFTLVIAVILAVLTALSLSLAGTARAAAVPRPESAIQAAGGDNGSATASAKPKQCFYTIPKCASSSPDVAFRIVSVGDTSGCVFKTTTAWGDKTTETKSFPGGADGATLATFTHTYKDKPDLYVVTITGQTTTGSCGAASGTLDFTLECPAAGSAANAQAATSTNWAGYVAQSSPVNKDCYFTSVTGRWIQPKVTCPPADKGTLEVDFWVGLDGQDSHTVEQTGIEVTCVWNAGKRKYDAPRYRGWYEMFPDLPVYTGGGFGTLNPRAGSVVTATVTYNGNAQENPYDLVLTVTSAGKTHRGNVTRSCVNGDNSACRDVNAEWIAEKVLARPLASFTPWKLTGGYATTSKDSHEHPVASFKPLQYELDQGGKILARTCGLSGASFIVRQSVC